MGSERCACYGNGTCDSALQCLSNLCVAKDTGGSNSGGTTNAGARTGVGGTSNAGGVATGGASNAGGNNGTGGASNAAGNANAGGGSSGAMNLGGSTTTGGNESTGGATAISGSSTTGGTKAIGGSSNTGGVLATGGSRLTGGFTGAGGTLATGGTRYTGGATSNGSTQETGGTTTTGGTPAIIRVQSRGQADVSSATYLLLNISVCNVSGAPLSLSGITLKYWYTADAATSTPAVSIDYSSVAPTPTATAVLLDVSVFRTNADAVMQMKFDASSLATGACTGQIQLRIYSQNYTCCYAAQAGDYSYLASSTFADNQNITAYDAQGLLIWGLEPALVP